MIFFDAVHLLPASALSVKARTVDIEVHGRAAYFGPSWALLMFVANSRFKP